MVWLCRNLTMMTSSNRNIFRVTGPFVRGIHWSPVNPPHRGQCRFWCMYSKVPFRSNVIPIYNTTYATYLSYRIDHKWICSGWFSRNVIYQANYLFNMITAGTFTTLLPMTTIICLPYGQWLWSNSNRTAMYSALSIYRGHFRWRFHESHPIARPWGRGMGCRSWIQSLPGVLPLWLHQMSCMYYRCKMTAMYWGSIVSRTTHK